MAEGLIVGVRGGEEEKPEVEAPRTVNAPGRTSMRAGASIEDLAGGTKRQRPHSAPESPRTLRRPAHNVGGVRRRPVLPACREHRVEQVTCKPPISVSSTLWKHEAVGTIRADRVDQPGEGRECPIAETGSNGPPALYGGHGA
jgi:hypothetical protein